MLPINVAQPALAMRFVTVLLPCQLLTLYGVLVAVVGASNVCFVTINPPAGILTSPAYKTQIILKLCLFY